MAVEMKTSGVKAEGKLEYAAYAAVPSDSLGRVGTKGSSDDEL